MTFKCVWAGAASTPASSPSPANAPIISFDLGPHRMGSPLDCLKFDMSRRVRSRVRKSFFLILDVALERKPLDHGVIAESFAQPVDCLLGLGQPAIDQIGKVGSVGIAQRGYADPDQTEHAAVAFARQQLAAGGENASGELGRMRERVRPRPDAEIGT